MIDHAADPSGSGRGGTINWSNSSPLDGRSLAGPRGHVRKHGRLKPGFSRASERLQEPGALIHLPRLFSKQRAAGTARKGPVVVTSWPADSLLCYALRGSFMQASRQNPLQAIARLLSEARMGFLALVAFGAGMVQLAFELDPSADTALEVVAWAIVATFAVDYAVTLLLSKDRRAYAFSPWGLLDLAIVVCPLLTLLPGVGNALQSTPILRLLRLTRAAVFGARASRAAMQVEETGLGQLEARPLRVMRMDDGMPAQPSSLAEAVTGMASQAAS